MRTRTITRTHSHTQACTHIRNLQTNQHNDRVPKDVDVTKMAEAMGTSQIPLWFHAQGASVDYLGTSPGEHQHAEPVVRALVGWLHTVSRSHQS